MDRLDARRTAAVELAHDHGTPTTVQDDARAVVVGAEIDEAADRARRPDDLGDHPLVQPVLGRDHYAVRREMGGERSSRSFGVLSLHGEQDGLEHPLHALGRGRAGANGMAVDRAGDLEAGAVDRRDVILGTVDEQDLVAGPHQRGANAAADCAGAPDQDPRAHCQGPSRSSRVSATATAQIACISSSGRW